MSKTFVLRVWRGMPGSQYWEEFELGLLPFMNITSALLEVQKNPINRKKERVAPVTWEQGCLEEVCGACSMLINGMPRQGCTALVENIIDSTASNTITLAPMTKFPLVRDLVINRTGMFENLKKVRAWVDVDDSFDRGFGPKIDPRLQETMYVLSTCMTCGVCSESCPQVNSRSNFIGPAPISQVRLFNSHPIGKMQTKERVDALMQDGGISDCGNAQNCVQVCPKKIPLTESIAVMGRQVVKEAFKELVNTSEDL